ncbi:MAG TPA: anti-sigma factor [Halothiobacillus sp.]|nr:anti-sigma factor [Halothiobacillus sp.]
MNRSPISETDLHAYVDNQLSSARRAEVEAFLAARPEEAARVAAYRRQNQQLQDLLDPVLDEAIPPHLQQPSRVAPRLNLRFAAVVTWVFVGGIVGSVAGGVVGWQLRGSPPMLAQMSSQMPRVTEPLGAQQATVGERLAWRAAVAHAVYSPDTRRPVEIGADQEDQLVAWLSKRLGVKLKPPSLKAQGYELIGGRLLPGSEGPVAQFMYHDAKGKRLTLYVSGERQDKQDTAFHFATEGPIGVFYWIDNGMGYAISAGSNKNELARVALAVYNQINPK